MADEKTKNPPTELSEATHFSDLNMQRQAQRELQKSQRQKQLEIDESTQQNLPAQMTGAQMPLTPITPLEFRQPPKPSTEKTEAQAESQNPQAEDFPPETAPQEGSSQESKDTEKSPADKLLKSTLKSPWLKIILSCFSCSGLGIFMIAFLIIVITAIFLGLFS
jgi:hypothetical protein